MKKKYMTPTVEVVNINAINPLLTISAGDRGLGYGGVDTEGELDPSSREFDVWWDD